MIKTVPLLTLPADQVQTYWQTLYMHDKLGDRLGDVVDPTWTDVVNMIVHSGKSLFHILDDDRVVADIGLQHYNGASAQAHGSIHPELELRHALPIAREGLKQLFEITTLASLWALIPIVHRTSVLVAQKIGFKIRGIAPQSLPFKGRVEDSYFMTVTK